MSFAGHVFDMINRMKSNSAHRNALKEKLKERKKNLLIAKTGKSVFKENIENLSPEEINIIKMKIRKDMKREWIVYQIKVIAVTVLIMFIFCLAAYYIYKIVLK